MNRWIKHKFSRKNFFPLHITPVRKQTQHTRPAIAAYLSKDSLEHKGQNQRLITVNEGDNTKVFTGCFFLLNLGIALQATL